MYKRSNRSNRFSNKARSNFSNNRNKRRIKNFNDISKFVNKAVETTEEEYVVQNQFVNFQIDLNLKQNILKKGYQSPTPIQDKSINHILDSRDLLGIANTGTGKTGAFLIPLIDKVLKDESQKVLIIAPTRELALQIEREFYSLAKSFHINSVLCMGGTSMYKLRKDLDRRFNFVIGTPGRIKASINDKILDLSNFRSIVLDEVDRMLDMGFVKDVKEILSFLPKQRQSLFFSATIDSRVTELIKQNSSDLITVSVKKTDTAKTIDQDIVRFKNQEDKLDVLHKLLIQKEFEKVLVFGRTKHGVKKLAQKLNNRGFRADSIHGNKSQPQRQRALRQFNQNSIKVLVATDVASRGLDIDNVTHVINYDLPESYEDYIHRIGRTGRANKKGKALTFVG